MNTDIQAGADRAPAAPESQARRPPRVLGAFPLMLGFISGILLCAGVFAALPLLRGGPAEHARPSPQTAANEVCAALRKQDYPSLYGLLSSGQRTTGTQDQFAASQRQLDITEGYARTCSAAIRTVDSEQANVTFVVTRGGNSAIDGVAHMIYEQGSWKLDTYDARVL